MQDRFAARKAARINTYMNAIIDVDGLLQGPLIAKGTVSWILGVYGPI